MNKLLLGLGALSLSIIPITTVVSCSDNHYTKVFDVIKDILKDCAVIIKKEYGSKYVEHAPLQITVDELENKINSALRSSTYNGKEITLEQMKLNFQVSFNSTEDGFKTVPYVIKYPSKTYKLSKRIW
ncbi:MAG: Vmc-like lipoprotein signal peptide domain-containing protein [Metamycoplasmataceae bacterium]